MNMQSLRTKTGLAILVSALFIVLIYSVDLFKLYAGLTGWEQFGEMPVPVGQIRYFVANTPNVIGYAEPGSAEAIRCATTVAYVRTPAGEEYRCCDSGARISCLAGDYPRDIPIMEEACTGRLQEIFGIPAELEGAVDYQLYGSCPEGSAGAITVVQLDSLGHILWKSLDAGAIAILVSGLRCILAPLLLFLAIGLGAAALRGKRYQPARRF